MLKFITSRMTPLSAKLTPTSFQRKKTQSPVKEIPTTTQQTLNTPPSQRLRPLIAQKDSRKLIQRSFFIFNKPQFTNDHIHKVLSDLCSCSSFQRLMLIIHSEIATWNLFSDHSKNVFGRKTHLLRQIDQKSTDTEPNSHYREFLELSFTYRLLF